MKYLEWDRGRRKNTVEGKKKEHSWEEMAELQWMEQVWLEQWMGRSSLHISNPK